MTSGKRVLILYPSTANKATITLPVPIISGIARARGWEVAYFDTTGYAKRQDAIEEKETTGGFKPGITRLKDEKLQADSLAPDLQAALDSFRPDVLCVTTMSCDYEFLMTFFPSLRVPEGTTVVIGGIHAIVRTSEVMASGVFDLACTGQGEPVIAEIFERAETGRGYSGIKGTWRRDKPAGTIERNPGRELLLPENLWSLETDYSVYSDKYFLHPFDGKMVRMFWLEVARGCPYNCTYCGNSALREAYKGLGRYVCERPMDSIFKLLGRMTGEYRIDIFNFTDECFLAHPLPWLREFGARYAAGVRKSFLIQTRPETVTAEKLDVLRAFGAPFFQVGMGVESGSERVLNELCNRRTPVKEIVRAYDLLHERGVRSNAYFMIGFPTETREEVFQTIELCRRIRADINVVSIFQPLPGQKLTEFCIEKGYITGREPMETFTSASVLRMPQFSREEITALRRTFLLYAKLPEKFRPQIERCERDFENNRPLFDELVALRWEYESGKKT